MSQAGGRKHVRARALLESLWQTRRDCRSIQVLQEFHVTVTRKVAAPLDRGLTGQIVADLGAWRIHVPTVADILAAVELQSRYRLSFWDAMVLHSANALGCRLIWTEDLNHDQQYDRVAARNPFRDDGPAA